MNVQHNTPELQALASQLSPRPSKGLKPAWGTVPKMRRGVVKAVSSTGNQATVNLTGTTTKTVVCNILTGVYAGAGAAVEVIKWGKRYLIIGALQGAQKRIRSSSATTTAGEYTLVTGSTSSVVLPKAPQGTINFVESVSSSVVTVTTAASGFFWGGTGPVTSLKLGARMGLTLMFSGTYWNVIGTNGVHPYGYAYMSATAQAAYLANSKMPLATLLRGGGGMTLTTTTHGLVIPVPGIYHAIASIDTTTPTEYMSAQVWQNGGQASGFNVWSPTTSVDLKCAAGDKIYLYTYQRILTPHWTIAATSSGTFLDVHWVGPY